MEEECLPIRQVETTVLSINQPTEVMVTGEIALLCAKIISVLNNRKDSLGSSLMVTVLKAGLLLPNNAVISLLKAEAALAAAVQCSHKAGLPVAALHHAALAVGAVAFQDLQVVVAADHRVVHQAEDHAAAEEEDFNFL